MSLNYIANLGLCAVMATAAPALAQTATPQPEALAVLHFSVDRFDPAADPMAAAQALARAGQAARIELTATSDDAQRLDGVLVFDGLDAFAEWNDSQRDSYFEPLGGPAAVETSLSFVRPALVERANLQRDGVDEMDVTYRNTGNDAAGDSDIDAVTVLCPGDHADCKPSN